MDDLIPGTENVNEAQMEAMLIKMVAESNRPTLRKAEEMIEEFTVITNEDIPTFSKSHFEEHFLSYFLSQEYTPEMVRAWVINVAGSPMSPVKLLDDEGNVAVIVPGIVNTSNLDPDPGEHSNYTISAATEKFAKNRQTFAAKAVVELETDLLSHLKSKIRPSALTKQFFDYYSDWSTPKATQNEIINTDSDEFDESSMFE